MGREKLFVASQMLLVFVALVLQIVGFLLPFYAVIFEDMNLGPVVTGYFLAYTSPFNLLLLVTLDLVVIFVLGRLMRSANGKALVNSRILAYATLLFSIPSWLLVWASMMDYRPFIMAAPEVLHVRLGLMSGFYIYSLGCALLVAAQALYPVAMRRQKPTSEEALQWAHRHRLDIMVAVLLLIVTPLTLILVPGFPIM